MNISEMHVMFRQYAQQMGMQNVRAILPEQIDLLLNTSIMDIVNQTIKENIGVTNDRVITDNSKIGQINALRTLYKVALIDMSPAAIPGQETRAFAFNISDRNNGRMSTNFAKRYKANLIPDYLYLVDFSLSYKKVKDGTGYTGIESSNDNIAYSILTPTAAINGTYEPYASRLANRKGDGRFFNLELSIYRQSDEEYVNPPFLESRTKVINSKEENVLYCIDDKYVDGDKRYIAVEGLKSSDSTYGGRHYVFTDTFKDGDGDYNDGVLYNPFVKLDNCYAPPIFDDHAVETNYFPVRIIDDAYLADTLNDFVLRNRLRSPIIVTYNKDTFDLYIDKFNEVTISGTDEKRYVLQNNLLPYKLRMSYIAKPAKVRYAEDLEGENVDCDLPEYQHIDVVKHAVDLYRIAVSGSLHAAQQQEQAAQQEAIRNNYRNDNNNNRTR